MKNSRNTWKLSFAADEPPLPHVYGRRFSGSLTSPWAGDTIPA